MIERSQPTLHIAVGDPGGIGPLALLPALKGLAPENLRLYGPPKRLAELAVSAGVDLPEVVAPEGLQETELFLPEPRAENGAWALASLGAAVRACSPGDVLLTLPVHKAAVAMVQAGFQGQTEWLRRVFPERHLFMAYRPPGGGPDLVLLTEHCSLARGLRRLEAMDLDAWWGAFSSAWAKSMGPLAQAALMGVNPHAGEQGLMGSEETRLLTPWARRAGLLGPWAPDTALPRAIQDKVGMLVAPLHDLGLGPFKVRFPDLLHLTLGLPFLRVSPSHGVAYAAAAGQAPADPGPIRKALAFALNSL